MTLEDKLPQCPIHKEIENMNLTTCNLVVYGHKSGDCTSCEGNNIKDCEVYTIWYKNKYGLKEEMIRKGGEKQ